MSRGPGRVQRRILEVLEEGPLGAPDLARAALASESSTRRALRALAQAGQVELLGYQHGGAQRWGLPGARAALGELWTPERVTRLTGALGVRETRSIRRLLVAAI